MSARWPMAPLGDVLTPISRPERLEPVKEYRILGAHWYAEGLYVKDVRSGSEIMADKLFRVAEGDFVYNRLFAWKGSFAVATNENDECYVSGEFPCFQINKGSVEPQYLARYFGRASVWEEALGLSSGGTPTSRNRLKEEKLLSMRIPLPPLDEQRRIVARIEALASRIEEARRLRAKVREEIDALPRALLFGGSEHDREPTTMNELVRLRRPNVDLRADQVYRFAGVYCFGRGVFRGGVKSGMQTAYKQLIRISAGNFMFPKLMAWEGALGVVPIECDGLFVSPEFVVFDVNTQRVLPETLDVFFRTPSVWPLLAELSTGTNVRRRRLHPQAFLSFLFPLPSMSLQQRVRALAKATRQVLEIQTEIAEELEQLFPSIVDRAFCDELVRGAICAK